MGSVLDSPIASALRAPAFLIKAFGKLRVDLACPDTHFLFIFLCFTVPFAAREGSGERAALRAQPQGPGSSQHSQTPEDGHTLGRLLFAVGSPKTASGCSQSLPDMQRALFVDIQPFFYPISHCSVTPCALGAT